MQVKSIAECSKGSILQYFRPSLWYHLLLRSLFCLFLSSRFTQVLLYFHCTLQNKKKSFYKYQKYFRCPKTNIQFKRKVVIQRIELCLLILILRFNRASFGNIYLLKANLTLALFILLHSLTKIIYKVRFLAKTVWFLYIQFIGILHVSIYCVIQHMRPFVRQWRLLHCTYE